MAKPRSIGNMIAPWRFLLFLALLVVGVPVGASLLHRWALGGDGGVRRRRRSVFLLVCLPLLGMREAARHPRACRAERRQPHAAAGASPASSWRVLLVAIAAETVGQQSAAVHQGADHRHARRSPGCSATRSTRSITRTSPTATERTAASASISRARRARLLGLRLFRLHLRDGVPDVRRADHATSTSARS